MSNDTASGSKHVSWIFELTIKEGREADLRALAAEMSAATERNESGTLDYEWYVTDDGRHLHLWERYADADAAMSHTATFGERYAKRFFDVLTPTRMVLLGAVDDRLRAAMAELTPLVIRRASGFSRQVVRES